MFKRYNSIFCFNTNKPIIMRPSIFLLLILIFLSCEPQPKVTLETREIELNGLTKDSSIVFLKGNDTLKIYREIEITENQNTDTLSLGYVIIQPREIGKIWFIQTNLDPSRAAYLDDFAELDPTKPWSYAQLFTIGLDNHKYERGFKKIKIRLKLKHPTHPSSP